MRIVYILDTLARIGGLERIITDKMNWLADNGHEVTLITAAQGDHPHSFPLSGKVRHTDIDARFHVQYRYRYPMRLFVRWQMDRRFRRNLNRAIETIDPDVIVATTYYKADVVSGLKCRAAKIIESHNARPFTGRMDGVRRNAIIQWFHDISLRRYNRRIERKADAVVTLTEGDAREWAAARRVFVIPNIYVSPPDGCITSSDSCITPTEDGERPCRRRVIAAGRLVYQKGFDMLIDAWAIVAKPHPDWTLDIFGAGEEQQRLEQQIQRLGLEGRVRLNRPTPDILKEYSRSDMLVVSSRFEGFSLVLVEAMSCGTPCISFDCQYGPSEVIRDREDGLLVENGNIGQLATTICHLIENDEERLRYGRRAAENITRYRPENVMPMWTDLFAKLTEGRKTAR